MNDTIYLQQCTKKAIDVLHSVELSVPRILGIYPGDAGFCSCQTWSIQWHPNDAKSIHATCSYRNRTISLRPHLKQASEHDVVTTCIHELLHVLYPSDGHRGKWKQAANRITARTEYTITRTATIHCANESTPKYRYSITCPCCHKEWKYLKASPRWKHIETLYCQRCGKDATKGKLQLKRL